MTSAYEKAVAKREAIEAPKREAERKAQQDAQRRTEMQRLTQRRTK